ncbi:MAG TPA: GntR family transcriptional regulator [Bacillota bacterium]|jgi:DNA-binding GntR family transcriptional regulator|nr:GntR family transcriptional regulator [Bacillota bacterium]
MGKKVVKNSLTDQAYELIIEKIQRRELLPGDRINIEEMAREFDVSRTPMREAISRLIQNGFLEANHNVGPSVAVYDAKKSADLIETNSILMEGTMKVIFEEGLKPEWIKTLQSIVDEQKSSYKKGDTRAFSDSTVFFHKTLINECPNLKLRQLAGETQTQLTVWVYRYQESDENKLQSIEEHQKMVDFLNNDNRNEFIDLLKKHNERAYLHFQRK